MILKGIAILHMIIGIMIIWWFSVLLFGELMSPSTVSITVFKILFIMFGLLWIFSAIGLWTKAKWGFWFSILLYLIGIVAICIGTAIWLWFIGLIIIPFVLLIILLAKKEEFK